MTKDDFRGGASLLATGGGGMTAILCLLGLGVWFLGPDLEDGRLPRNAMPFQAGGLGASSAGIGGAGDPSLEGVGPIEQGRRNKMPSIQVPPPPEPSEPLPPEPEKSP